MLRPNPVLSFAHELGNMLDIKLNGNRPGSKYGENYGDPSIKFEKTLGRCEGAVR
jgi:hypothetical protein